MRWRVGLPVVPPEDEVAPEDEVVPPVLVVLEVDAELEPPAVVAAVVDPAPLEPDDPAEVLDEPVEAVAVELPDEPVEEAAAEAVVLPALVPPAVLPLAVVPEVVEAELAEVGLALVAGLEHPIPTSNATSATDEPALPTKLSKSISLTRESALAAATSRCACG